MRPPHKELRTDLACYKGQLSASFLFVDFAINSLKEDDLENALKLLKESMELLKTTTQDLATYCHEIKELLKERKEQA